MKTRVATFQKADCSDVEVRYLEQGSERSASILTGDPDKRDVYALDFPQIDATQLSEALQFLSDTVGESVPDRMHPFARSWHSVSQDVLHCNTQNGFWEQGQERNKAELIALIHSELSEALEALRKDLGNDEHCPEFLNIEVELADAVIRIMDMAAGFGYRLPEAILAKLEVNKGRGKKHGKQF